MEEEKPKIIIIGGGSIGANIAKNFGVTDMGSSFKDFVDLKVQETKELLCTLREEIQDTPLSGREKRRQRRKQQRKNK
jgi:hypothetical protein